MDMVARELGHATRSSSGCCNCLGPGKTTVTGQVLDEHAGRVDLCIQRVADEIGLRPAAARKTPYRGKGIACAVKAPGDAERRRLVGGHEVRRGRDARDPHLRHRLRPGADDRRGAVRGRGARPADGDDPRARQPRHRPLALRLADGRLAPDLGDRQRDPPRRPRSSRRQLFAMAAQALGVPAARAGAPAAAPSSTRRPGSRCRSPRWSWATSSPTATPSAGRSPRPPSYLPEGLLFLDPETSQSAKPVAKWTFGAQARRALGRPGDRAGDGRAGRGLLRRRARSSTPA